VCAAPFDIRLTRFSKLKNKEVTTVVQPDLCIICDPHKLDERGCIGAPDLVVEIPSPDNSRTEMKDKYDPYKEAGVREYRLVYPVERSVQLFQLNVEGRFISLQPYADGDTVTNPIVPGMEVALADVFDV
jgi:Uma2 family endonuclease